MIDESAAAPLTSKMFRIRQIAVSRVHRTADRIAEGVVDRVEQLAVGLSCMTWYWFQSWLPKRCRRCRNTCLAARKTPVIVRLRAKSVRVKISDVVRATVRYDEKAAGSDSRRAISTTCAHRVRSQPAA